MSTVVVKSLKWDNCFSFGENNSIELNLSHLTQIIAPNGFGKSSIPIILEESLYNKNSKGVKKSDIPNRIVNSGYEMQVDFLVGNQEYSVLISRGSSIKVKLLHQGVDISSHTATNTFKTIQDLIGIDFKIFQQLVYQSTNSSLQFLTATDTGRKKFLIELFDLSEYTALFEVFKAQTTLVSSEVSKLESSLKTTKQWLDNNADKVNQPIMPLKLDIDFVDRSEEIGTIISNLNSVKERNDKIKVNNSLISELSKIDLDKHRDTISNKSITNTNPMQEDIGKLKAEKDASSNVIKKLNSLEDKCPTCLQDIDKEFFDQLLYSNTNSAEAASAKIKEITDKISEINKTNLLVKTAQSELNKWDDLNSKIDFSMSKETETIEDIESRLKSIRQEVSSLNKEAEEIREYNKKSENHNNTIAVYTKQSEEFSAQVKEITSELNTVVENLKNLEVLKKAFSTNGLIAFKLENLVKDLEDFSNMYLSELSDGRFTIEFNILGDKLNVNVTDEGREINMASPSSGELARINISTLLAIRKLMSSISKNTINVLFLDEVISVLDDYGREQLVEVLLKEEGLNTFLVSHSWTHPLVDKIVLDKENGISRIV